MSGRLAFTLDLGRCTGCQACVLACSTWNELGWGRSWRRVETFNPARDPRAPHHHLSLACNHCDRAPCAASCPAGAFDRDPLSGMVTLAPDRCIGCRYCAWTCPFAAPRFDEQAGVMGKCTQCPERLAAGDEPACVHACPTGALDLRALATVDGTLVARAPGLPVTAAEPSIRFRPGTAGPETSWELDPELVADFGRAAPPEVGAGGLAHEWPLWLFTLGSAGLTALVTAAVAAGRALSPWLAVAALAAAGVSTLHLGRPTRAWRAVLGVRTSWLAREVALFGLFALLLAASSLGPGIPGLGVAAAAAGWATLVAADRVYDPVRRPRGPAVHSGDAVPTAVTWLATLTGPLWLAAAVVIVRLTLYTARRQSLRAAGGPHRPTLSLVRITVGALVPVAAVWPTLDRLWWVVLAALVVGDAIDRAELYLELAPLAPREVAAADLGRMLTGPS